MGGEGWAALQFNTRTLALLLEARGAKKARLWPGACSTVRQFDTHDRPNSMRLVQIVELGWGHASETPHLPTNA
jgi:hypothetical protein